MYWFCHTLTWIWNGCTCVLHPEPPSHLPPHPSAPAPSILYDASNLDWWFVSHMIIYMFQCHSPISSCPLPLPQSPSFIWGKMRTAAWEAASQIALRDCSKAAVGENQCIRFWWRGSSIPWGTHGIPCIHGILQVRILEWVACPSPGDLPHPGPEPTSPALQSDSLPLSHLGNPLKQIIQNILELLDWTTMWQMHFQVRVWCHHEWI